jgi:glycosyltransferase involved in cell wall biosynthesis
MIAEADPDALHIATEGPLGVVARGWALAKGLDFTTAYHTQFPDYVARRTRLPAAWFWNYIRWFHRPASAILVSTRAVAAQLAGKGLGQTRLWGRGVDLSCFHDAAAPDPRIAALPRPIQLHVGRVAVEKNIDAFLAARTPGSKIVVGDGPSLESLKRRHRDVLFLGALRGAALASAYAAADVFVFPSRTDTFGLVMIEALACGTPVAAYPVPGPLDVVEDNVGCLDEDLDAAIAGALKLDRARCAEFARGFSWRRSADQFRQSLVPIGAALTQHVVARGAPPEPRGARTATGSGRATS